MWRVRVQNFLKNRDYTKDKDWLRTSALKDEVQNFKRLHPGEGLPRILFDEIVDWKLRSQRARVERHLEKITDDLVLDITAAAFSVKHADIEELDRVRINLLMALPGVGLGISSAILTLYHPHLYGIIDFRAWDEVNNVEPHSPSLTRTFTIAHLVEYLRLIRNYSAQSSLPPQLIDFALWKAWEVRRK